METQGGKKKELRVREVLVLCNRKEKTHSNTDANLIRIKDSSTSTYTNHLLQSWASRHLPVDTLSQKGYNKLKDN